MQMLETVLPWIIALLLMVIFFWQLFAGMYIVRHPERAWKNVFLRSIIRQRSLLWSPDEYFTPEVIRRVGKRMIGKYKNTVVTIFVLIVLGMIILRLTSITSQYFDPNMFILPFFLLIGGWRFIMRGLTLLSPLRPRWETEKPKLYHWVQKDLRLQRYVRSKYKREEDQSMDPAMKELIGQFYIAGGIGGLILFVVMLLAMLNEVFEWIETALVG